MKKALALILAFTFVFALAACTNKNEVQPGATETGSTEFAFTKPTYTWPEKDNVLFGDVPVPSADLAYYTDNKNDKGYTYEFDVKELEYDGFVKYIKALKKAGFEFYDNSGLGLAATEPTLPGALTPENPSATWLGSRSGFYVSVIFSDASLEPDYMLKINFFTYNPFE